MGTSHRTGSEASARGRLGRQRGERLVDVLFFFLSPCSPKKPWEFEDFKHHLVSFLWLRWWVSFFLLQNPMVGPIPYKNGDGRVPLYHCKHLWFSVLEKMTYTDSGQCLIGFNWDWMKTAQESFKFERENLRILGMQMCLLPHMRAARYLLENEKKVKKPNFGSRGSIGLLMLLVPTIYYTHTTTSHDPSLTGFGLRKPWFLHCFCHLQGLGDREIFQPYICELIGGKLRKFMSSRIGQFTGTYFY